jgi:hypothetical protein
VLKASDRNYFLFPVKRVQYVQLDGSLSPAVTMYQYRREIGEGHSREERAMRRERRRIDYATRRLYKRERAAAHDSANA